MNFQSFDHLSLYYESHGDPAAPPLILIHGIGADHAMWEPQITSLPAAGYFVITPDLRGHGQSEVPPTFRISDCVRDLVDLASVLNLQRVHLIGVSMGGMVAQQFVIEHPAHAITQILVDTLSGVIRPAERFNASLAAFLLKFFPPKLQAYLIRRTYKRMGHGEVGRYLAERLLAMPSRWLLEARREINRFCVITELPKMDLPTLVLVGDAFGKLAINMARTTADRIPGAQLRILQGGGDPSNLLVPASFDRAVLDFLAKRRI